MSNEVAGSPVALTESRTADLSSNGHIVILSQPSEFVFWDEWFHIGLCLRLLVGLPLAVGTVALKAELVPGSTVESIVGEYVVPASINDAVELLVDGEQPIRISVPMLDPTTAVGKENVTFIRCKIQRNRIVPGTNTFSIRFFCDESTFSESNMITAISQTEGPWIATCTTKMKMVTSCLQLVTENWPQVWYKDEGGRDKCMQVIVRLVDREGQPVLSRCFQIHLTLVYDNDTRSPVLRQDILRLLGQRKNYIDPETGCAIVLFRIEDVSKNHQGLSFIIRVDTEASIDDVASAFSPPVSVRSKRNKRSREVTPIDANISPTALDVLAFSPSRSHGTTDFPAIQNALKRVIEWSSAVIQGLYPLRWSVLGFTQLSDGSLDQSQPFHSMQNPNDFISKIAFMYSSEVQQHLHLLQLHLDTISGSPIGRSLILNPHQLPITSSLSASSNFRPLSPLSYRLAANQALNDSSKMLPSSIQQQVTPRSLPLLLHHSLPQQHLLQTNTLPVVTPMTIHHRKTPSQNVHHMDIDNQIEARQAEIRFILAKQFKSIRTGERLGFPAFNEANILLGFFVESNRKLGTATFVPIEHFDEFGPNEIAQARSILDQAMDKYSQAVLDINSFHSLESMVDHALVYQWTKELQLEKEKSSNTHSFG